MEIYLPQDEYDNFKNWEMVENQILAENYRREVERSTGVFEKYEPQVNPYLNDLLRKTFRKVKALKLIGATTFLLETTSTTNVYPEYDHKNEIGGDIYG
jgi:hypothetical protein